MKIHFVGIKGVSMSALSSIMQSYGHDITGSDLCLNGHDPANVIGAELVVYTSAVGHNNVEITEAKRLHIPIVERAEFLGMLAENFDKVIGISGAHGKTTTTAMISHLCSSLKPTVHIGGKLNGKLGSILGGKDIFITECCEYKRHFLSVKPSICVITGVELDHTDYYKDLDDVIDAYRQFVSGSQIAVINIDDVNSMTICEDVTKKITFGTDSSANYRACNIECNAGFFSFTLLEYGVMRGEYTLNVAGYYNLLNALAAIAACRLLGVSHDIIKSKLNTFETVDRRFQNIGKLDNKTTIIMDYAHHPSEIRNCISTASKCFGGKIFVVFQPHTFSRTISLLDEFAEELSKADFCLLLPIFHAREDPIEGVTSQLLLSRILPLNSNSTCCLDMPDAEIFIRNFDMNGYTIIIMGAGDIENMKKIATNY